MPQQSTFQGALAAPQRPISLPVVQQVGRWRLLDLLGQGRFADVYRAAPSHEGAAGASYAVKVLRGIWQTDPRGIEMLCCEALVGSRVAHPHLVAVLASSVRRPPLYLVMPLLTGATLNAWAARHRPVLVPQALWLVRQTASAAAALHDAGWLHGDIKPANVMLSTAGHATLIDLGFVQGAGQHRSALLRPLLGTPYYMAPELLTSALAATPASDVYSLGVILYELLSGRRPFEADDVAELITQHRQGEVCDIRRHRPELTPLVADLLRSMLARDPARRPLAYELVEQLLRLEIDSLDDWAIDCDSLVGQASA